MSIIYNALKKAGEKKLEVDAINASELMSSDVELTDKSNYFPLYAHIALSLMAIGLIVFALTLLTSAIKNEYVVNQHKNHIKSAPSIVLNGVLTSGDGNIAVMNGHNYIVGEKIDGMTILDIKINRVTLSNNGKFFVVSNH